MAGYNVQTPPLFTVKDPQQLVQFDLNRLNATIVRPEKTTTYDVQGYVDPYYADDLIGGYIIRRGQGDWDDYFDEATNIIDAMKRKQLAISNDPTVRVGDSFTLVYTNFSNDWIWLYGNNGTEVSDPLVVYDGDSAKCTFTVVDLASLGQGHDDRVNVFVCGGNYELLFLSDVQKAKVEAHKTKMSGMAAQIAAAKAKLTKPKK